MPTSICATNDNGNCYNVSNDNILVKRLVAAVAAIDCRCTSKPSLLPLIQFDPTTLQQGSVADRFRSMDGVNVLTSAMKTWPGSSLFFMPFANTVCKVDARMIDLFCSEEVHDAIAFGIKMAAGRSKIHWKNARHAVEMMTTLFRSQHGRVMMNSYEELMETLEVLYLRGDCPWDLFTMARELRSDIAACREQMEIDMAKDGFEHMSLKIDVHPNVEEGGSINMASL